MSHATFYAVGLKIEARSEAQGGGVAPPGVAITLASPSMNLASRELRLEPALAKKLLADVGALASGRRAGPIVLSDHVSIDVHRHADGAEYKFKLPGATIFVRGLFVSEMLAAIQRIIEP